MEKIVPNQFVNRLNNSLLFGKIQTLFMKRLLLLLVLALYCANATAQDVRISQNSPIMEVDAYIAQMRATEAASRNSTSSSVRLEKLLREVQPAVYYLQGEVKTYGESPTCLFTNPASLRSIDSAVSNKTGIEIVTIHLNQVSDLNTQIDLSVFSSFPNLKYIYILSTVETSGAAITQQVRNNNNGYGVFYKVDKGS